MNIDPNTGITTGQIGSCRGWSVCRSIGDMPDGTRRLTVTVTKGNTSKWRDWTFRYSTPEAVYDIAQEMESVLRQIVCEVEDLEMSWRVTA
jgi:hypothetical protein